MKGVHKWTLSKAEPWLHVLIPFTLINILYTILSSMKKFYKDETQSISAFKCKTTINNLPVLNLNHQDEVQKFNSNTCSSPFTTEHSQRGHTDTHTVFWTHCTAAPTYISFYALLEKFDQTGYALFVFKMLSFQYVPKCSISDIGFDIENYCTYFIILGCDNVFEIMISKWIVPGYSIRNSCNVIFVYMFLLHPFNFLQDQLNPKRRMWRSLKHGLRLRLDIMIQYNPKTK